MGAILNTQTAQLSGEFADNGSGIKPNSLQILPIYGADWESVPQDGHSFSFDAGPLFDGEYEVPIRIKDNLENLSAPTSFVFVIDTQPPLVSSLSPAPYSYSTAEQPTISASYTDVSGISIDDSSFALDGIVYDDVLQDSQFSFIPLIALEEGLHDVALTVVDNAGNASTVTWYFIVDTEYDSPRFTRGPDLAVLDCSGEITYASWATSITHGPPDEELHSLSFEVTNDNQALFSAQPVISSNGTLMFTPSLGADGVASVTVTLIDLILTDPVQQLTTEENFLITIIRTPNPRTVFNDQPFQLFLQKPNDDIFNQPEITVEGFVSNDDGPITIEGYIDGQLAATLNVEGQFSFGITAEDGPHDVYVIGREQNADGGEYVFQSPVQACLVAIGSDFEVRLNSTPNPFNEIYAGRPNALGATSTETPNDFTSPAWFSGTAKDNTDEPTGIVNFVLNPASDDPEFACSVGGSATESLWKGNLAFSETARVIHNVTGVVCVTSPNATVTNAAGTEETVDVMKEDSDEQVSVGWTPLIIDPVRPGHETDRYRIAIQANHQILVGTRHPDDEVWAESWGATKPEGESISLTYAKLTKATGSDVPNGIDDHLFISSNRDVVRLLYENAGLDMELEFQFFGTLTRLVNDETQVTEDVPVKVKGCQNNPDARAFVSVFAFKSTVTKASTPTIGGGDLPDNDRVSVGIEVFEDNDCGSQAGVFPHPLTGNGLEFKDKEAEHLLTFAKVKKLPPEGIGQV